MQQNTLTISMEFASADGYAATDIDCKLNKCFQLFKHLCELLRRCPVIKMVNWHFRFSWLYSRGGDLLARWQYGHGPPRADAPT